MQVIDQIIDYAVDDAAKNLTVLKIFEKAMTNLCASG